MIRSPAFEMSKIIGDGIKNKACAENATLPIKEELIMNSIGKGALLFLGGVLFGTAGVKVLSSKDAKKAYTHCTAAALRAKDCVMKTVTTAQENAGDIYAEAKQINIEREENSKPVELMLEPDESAEPTEENEI